MNTRVAAALQASAGVSVQRQQLGRLGEDLACRELTRRGYAVIARRYRRRRGELDIIAWDGPTLVFVEVKMREGRAFGLASETVGLAKRRRMVDVALDYAVRHHLADRPCRFDVVSIQLEGGRAVIEVFQNAFGVTTPR